MEQVIQALSTKLSSDQISSNDTVKELHSKDETYHQTSLPDVVVFPKSTEEVSFIMEVAQKFQTPVTPFGVGTSLEGHVIPYQNGLTIDFSLMNQILEIKESDLLVKVQPGVTREQLNKELKSTVFFHCRPWCKCNSWWNGSNKCKRYHNCEIWGYA